MSQKTYDPIVSLRMPALLRKRLDKLAAEQKRSFSKMVLILLNEALTKKK